MKQQSGQLNTSNLRALIYPLYLLSSDIKSIETLISKTI